MNILITGAKGFIGQNLVAELAKNKDYELFAYDQETDPSLLDGYCKDADFVFHLAGVNRPEDPAEYMSGNFGSTSVLLDKLKSYMNTCPIMIASSIQAELDNPYGKSKKAGEELMFAYSQETGAPVYVYRFPNVFGKWCRPNYNSVIATFCHNIAHDLPIHINNPHVVLSLVYIDDVVEELIEALKGNPSRSGQFCDVPTVYSRELGDIAENLFAFRESRNDLLVPNLKDSFIKKLYSTYLSYLPTDGFGYELDMKTDARGSFTEFMKFFGYGQVSINVAKPGIVKGNHWHHTKVEKFLVVSGDAIIRFRKIDSSAIIEYKVSGDKLKVIDIPPGYTHNIENIGSTDLVTVMWANEEFDPEHPDTTFLEV